MVLYGSQTSPFVRRLRLLLPKDTYRFQTVDIFSPEEREKFVKLSPLLKIPVLDIESKILWDSRVIFRELCLKGFHRSLNAMEENILTAISDLSDSLVQTLLAKRSNVIFPKDSPLEISHRERIENTLPYLQNQLEGGYFKEWNFLSMCLYSLIDWIEFRQLANLSPYPLLVHWKAQNQHQPRISETDPRLPLNQ